MRSGADDYENYDNETVQQIRHDLGEFRYEGGAEGHGREERDTVVLDNRARYEGQWHVASNTKDGRGK